MTRATRLAAGLVPAVAGGVLLVWYLRRIGLDRVGAGLAETGAGFIVILGCAFVRYMLRTTAWLALLEPPVRKWRALAAVIGGDALGNLTPIGIMVSEPAKAVYFAGPAGAERALAVLIAENFFYMVSIGIYILAGAAAMIEAFDLPSAVRLTGLWSIVAMVVFLAGAVWTAHQQPTYISALLARAPMKRLRRAAARVRAFEDSMYQAAGRPGVRFGALIAAEAAFNIVSFLEAWYTLWLLTGTSLPLEAFVLDAFGRFSNVVFRLIPLRIGVDQAGSGMVAAAMGLDPAIGATLSLIRTARTLAWALPGVLLVTFRAAPPSPSTS